MLFLRRFGLMILSENAKQIVRSRYLVEGEENEWSELAGRVGTAIAMAEPLEQRGTYAEQFSQLIYDLKFIPGGRILRNAGRPRGSLFNCYHLPIGDSIDEIGDCASNALKLWADGGGVGINFSSLRPSQDTIKGIGGKSSGLVSFMRAIDGLAACIESGGSRRAASLGSCDVSHPEIQKFIDAKLVDGTISYFNISVNITKSFLESVLSDSNWPLIFRGKVHDTVGAKELWFKILENMVNCGEPGILVWDNLIKNNSYYFLPITGTNPCGEAALGPYDVCNLGSIVLPQFVDVGGRTKWQELEHTVALAIRFLDNVIDVNKYRLESNKRTATNGRRIGLGVMGLAEYLFAKEVRYGSKAALGETADVLKVIRDQAYRTSVELAKEKGAFPAYDKIQYHKASFVRKLPTAIRRSITDNGIRNVTLLALAPTGTISLIPEVTGGIEPLFAKAYVRRDRVSTRTYVHPTLSGCFKVGHEVPSYVVDVSDLTPVDHLEMQSVCQRYVDGAVSKTINVPSTFTAEDLSPILFEYLYDIKGVTVYRDGSRSGQVLTTITNDEARKYVQDNDVVVESAVTDVESTGCATGACEL
jgi:ribonucleoside-diphosphate reductase alpha chain